MRSPCSTIRCWIAPVRFLSRSSRCANVEEMCASTCSSWVRIDLDALERRRVRDLVDRVRRELDRLADQPAVLGELCERILQTGRAERQRLEPVVARRDEAPDGLVPRDEAEDAVLLVGGVRARCAPHLRGDLAHQGRRVLLDRPQAVVQPFRDREVERGRALRRTGQDLGGVGATGEQSTPGAAGTFRRIRGIGVHVEASRSGAGAMRRSEA